MWKWQKRWIVTGIIFLVFMWWFGFHSDAFGGIYNNDGTLSEDSISIRFALLDTLGNPVQIDTTTDWGYVFVYYPGGDSCYSDSFIIAETDAHIEVNTSAEFTDRWGTYKDAVANIDGGGANGTYTWTMFLRDSSLALDTWFHGEFQLLTSGDLSTTVNSINKVGDSVLVDGSAFADLDSIFNSDQFKYNTITNAKVSSDLLPNAIPGSADGLLKVISGGSGYVLSDNNGKVYIIADYDTGFVAMKTKLTTIAGDVVNLDGGTLLTTSDNIGINWADVSNPTTALDLSATTIRSTDSALIVNIKASDTVAFAQSVNIKASDTITTVTGNVNGSVGSVTGAVGSVTGAVGSVTGNVGGNLLGHVQDSPPDSVDYVKANDIDSSDVTAEFKKMIAIRADSGSAASVSDAAMGAISDSVWFKNYPRGISQSASMGLAVDAIRDSMDEAAASGSGTSPWTAAGVDSAWTMINEFITDAPHSADYGGNTSSGSDAVACSLYAYDGATAIQGVRIWLYNSALSAIPYKNDNSGTNINGLSVFGVTASTEFKVLASKPGYTFDSVSSYQTINSGSGAYYVDTIPMTAIPVGSPSATNLCRITGHLYTSFGSPVYPGVVRFCAVQADAAKSGNLVIIPSCKMVPTDTLGAFAIDVIKSDSTTYPSKDTKHKYDIEAMIPDPDRESGEFKTIKVKEDVVVPDTSSYSMELFINP